MPTIYKSSLFIYVFLQLLNQQGWGFSCHQSHHKNLPLMFATLGDNHTDHFFPIPDYLETLKSSPENMTQTIKSDQSIADSKQKLKSYSATIQESEFSHLLEALVQSKNIEGASIFDTSGLKVGVAGTQVTGLRVDPKIIMYFQLPNASDNFEIKKTCQDMKKLIKSVEESKYLKANISIDDLKNQTKKCAKQYYHIYRPVFSRKNTSKVVGYSLVYLIHR